MTSQLPYFVTHQETLVLDAPMFISEYNIGRATTCEMDTVQNHRPRPLRFVWHHILPVTCGGVSKPDNLVQVCDSCHYAIHALLYDLKVHGKFVDHARYIHTLRAGVARKGYQRAKNVGTIDLIPDLGEGLNRPVNGISGGTG